MRLEASALLDFRADLLGKLGGIIHLALKHRVPALDIGLDVSAAEIFQEGNKLFHGQDMPSTNIDASKKCNICLHLMDLSSINFISAQCRLTNHHLQVEETCPGMLVIVTHPNRRGYRRALRKQSRWLPGQTPAGYHQRPNQGAI